MARCIFKSFVICQKMFYEFKNNKKSKDCQFYVLILPLFPFLSVITIFTDYIYYINFCHIYLNHINKQVKENNTPLLPSLLHQLNRIQTVIELTFISNINTFILPIIDKLFDKSIFLPDKKLTLNPQITLLYRLMNSVIIKNIQQQN